MCQVGACRDIRECLNMITMRSAVLLRLKDCVLEVARSADLSSLAVSIRIALLLRSQRARPPSFTARPRR
jgi:hypothetical protein